MADDVVVWQQRVAEARARLAEKPDDPERQSALGSALCDGLAPRLKAAGRADEAADAAREGIALTRVLLADTGRADRQGLAKRISEAAEYLPGEESVTETEVAVAVYREFVAAAPDSTDALRWLAWVLSDRLAHRQWRVGRQDATRVTVRESLTISVTLVERSPLDLLSGLARRYLVASVYLPLDEMLTHTRTAIELYRRVAAADPANEGSRNNLVWAMTTLATRLTQGGRTVEGEAAQAEADRVRRYGALSLFGRDYRFPRKAPIACVSRNPLQLDLFAVGEDGRAYSVWRNKRWEDYFQVGTKTFPPLTPIAGQSRNDDQMDIFAVGEDGGLWSAWWHGEWHDWFRIGQQVLPARAHVATLTRDPDYMDVFVVGDDGVVRSVWWHGEWRDWFTLPGAVFPKGAPLAALCRNSDHMEVWAVGVDGVVRGAWWNGEWHNWYELPGKTFPPGTAITAVSRNDDAMEIWAVDGDGQVWGAWWDGDWHDWYRLEGHTFPGGAPVTAVSRESSHMEVFGVDTNGELWGRWWDGQWRDWFRVGDGTLPQGTPLAAVARAPFPMGGVYFMDVFGVGADAGIHTAMWAPGGWRRWHRIPVAVLKFQQPIESGGAAALGGWAGVNISYDGQIQWHGHAHDSGADGYDFGVAFYVRSGDQLVALSHNGSVGGTVTSGSRDHDWEEIHPRNDLVLSHLANYATAQASMNMQYTSHIGQTLEGVVSFALKWFIGGSVAGSVTGLVVFIGVEIGSLIATGSLEPGAVALEGVLWMAGPSNSLLAIAAGAIAEVGHRFRELHQEEYDFAKATVFGDTLPPREKILLTDTVGTRGSSGYPRPFTVPGVRDKILINMGEEGFDDPLAFGVNDVAHKQGRPNQNVARGEIFIHELVHAWQIHRTAFSVSLLLDALSAQWSNETGGHPYEYGPAGPVFADLGIEQQAQIVCDWYGRHVNWAQTSGYQATGLDTQTALNDPYYRYIAGNIRVGKF